MKLTTDREAEMELVCRTLMGNVRHQGLPVAALQYDTDETGKLEWIHIFYQDKQVDHVDVTGLLIQEALEKVWRVLQKQG